MRKTCLVAAAIACLVALPWAVAFAAPPKVASVYGLALGTALEPARAALAKRYPNCAILPSAYHEKSGYPDNATAILDVARGTLDVCELPLGGGTVEESISLLFAHPEVDKGQPLYQIDFQRAYPDALMGSPPKILFPFDKLRAELLKTYGAPTEERREKMPSTAPKPAPGVAPAKASAREDYLVRYLWAEKGRITGNWEGMECDCGARFVRADVEISRLPSTVPKNQLYVVSLKLFVRDAEIGARQDAWNAQWSGQKKP